MIRTHTHARAPLGLSLRCEQELSDAAMPCRCRAKGVGSHRKHHIIIKCTCYVCHGGGGTGQDYGEDECGWRTRKKIYKPTAAVKYRHDAAADVDVERLKVIIQDYANIRSRDFRWWWVERPQTFNCHFKIFFPFVRTLTDLLIAICRIRVHEMRVVRAMVQGQIIFHPRGRRVFFSHAKLVQTHCRYTFLYSFQNDTRFLSKTNTFHSPLILFYNQADIISILVYYNIEQHVWITIFI